MVLTLYVIVCLFVSFQGLCVLFPTKIFAAYFLRLKKAAAPLTKLFFFIFILLCSCLQTCLLQKLVSINSNFFKLKYGPNLLTAH